MIYLLVFPILIVISFIKINIHIFYQRKGEEDELQFSIYKKLLKFKIPLVRINSNKKPKGLSLWFQKAMKKRKVKKRKQKKYIDKKSGFSFTQIQQNIDKVKLIYEAYKQVFQGVKKYIRGKIICPYFTLTLYFGLGDAALTGITTGGIWAFIYNVFSIINRIVVVQKREINVYPDFNEKRCDICFDSIFTIRIVHIIIVSVLSAFLFLKVMLGKIFVFHTSKKISNMI